MTFKDSGQRSEFATGAVRDIATNKGRFDLLPFGAIRQLARVMEAGCAKYGDRNWERGIPMWRYLDSALRHLGCLLSGMIDEPHGPMALWNLACLLQTEIWIREGRLPASLRDGFPFDIRLLPTGDLEEFAVHSAAYRELLQAEPSGDDNTAHGRPT